MKLKHIYQLMKGKKKMSKVKKHARAKFIMSLTTEEECNLLYFDDFDEFFKNDA